MKVAELARAGGVTAETVRHYTRQGLITARRDPVNNYQRFDEQALVRLKFISQARQLGFSLADIKQILEQADQHDSPCPLVRDLLRQHLPRVRERIRELEALAERMEHALDCWQDLPDQEHLNLAVLREQSGAGQDRGPRVRQLTDAPLGHAV